MTTIPRPMLAHKLTPSRKPTYPFYVQPKLNGIRAIWDGKGNLYSRGRFNDDRNYVPGKQFSPTNLRHIYQQLADIPLVLDGELYCHGLSLQQINSRVAVNRTTTHAEAYTISYHIFDCIEDLPFNKRWNLIGDVIRNYKSTVPVPTIFINSQTSEEAAYRLFRKQGFEGMMYRSINDPYGMIDECGNKENRWATLLKRKDWLDMRCRIVGVNEGKGEFAGSVGAFVLQTEDGTTFQAGSGLTKFQRKAYWMEDPVGRIAVVNYEMLSDGGVPLKPTIEMVEKKGDL